MQGTTKVVSMLARAGFALVLTGGCSPPPADAPPASASPMAPASTEAAPTSTASPSAAAGLEIAWEPIELPGEWSRMVHGAGGWVVIGACLERPCGPAAKVWHSADLATWETIELPRSGDVRPVSLSANRDGYLVSAIDYDDVGEHGETFLQVWRSSDGRSWERVGELRLGACDNDNCPDSYYVGLAPNGAVVANVIHEDVDESGHTYVSDDGVTWRETTIATSSRGTELDRIGVRGVRSTPTELFLFGSVCTGNIEPCEKIVWSTTDGVEWFEEQAFRHTDGVNVASDGVQRVATVVTCQTAVECTMDVSTGLRGTAWTKVSALDLDRGNVNWTGHAWVLAGLRGNQQAGDQGLAVYASSDGRTWAEVPSDVLGAPGDRCGGLLAAGAGVAVVADLECALWKGTVQLAR